MTGTACDDRPGGYREDLSNLPQMAQDHIRAGLGFIVQRDEWSADGTVRTIYDVVLVMAKANP